MALDLSGYIRKQTTIKFGDKELVFSELTLADMGIFHRWVIEKRKYGLKERRELIKADAKELGIDGTEILDRLSKPPTEDEIDGEMDTMEGTAFLAYLSLKHHHPEATEKDVGDIIGLSNVEEITKAMFPMLPGEVKKKPTTTPLNKKLGSTKEKK